MSQNRDDHDATVKTLADIFAKKRVDGTSNSQTLAVLLGGKMPFEVFVSTTSRERQICSIQRVKDIPLSGAHFAEAVLAIPREVSKGELTLPLANPESRAVYSILEFSNGETGIIERKATAAGPIPPNRG